ncbi:MAG: c-type cytochrome [Oligoflexus sp.]
MKSIGQLFSLLVSSAFLLMVTFACSGPEPVATQYKNSNPNGAAVTDTGNGDVGGDDGADAGDDGADAGDGAGDGAADPALVAQGEQVFTSQCAICHTSGPGPSIQGQNYTGQDFVDASENAAHGAIANWPSPEDSDALAAFANQ